MTQCTVSRLAETGYRALNLYLNFHLSVVLSRAVTKD